MSLEIKLSELGKDSESESLELKESFSSEALQTIGAFANARGGTLLIGVRDNGKLVGIAVGANTFEEWAQKIQTKIQPRILPSITIQKESGLIIGIVAVKKSHEPVSVDGRYYKRVGRTNQLMSNEEILQLILSSNKVSWDSEIQEGALVNELDQALIRRFLEELNKHGRRTIADVHNWQEALEKLRLLRNGKPSRAAILLFGKDIRSFHESAYIKAGRFKSAIEIVDDITFDGPLFEQLEKVTSWFKERLQRRFIIEEKVFRSEEQMGLGATLQRDVSWEYPIVALREGLVNAICHRDYKADVPITIRLFDNQLEIANPGSLTPYLTPSDLFKKHDSFPRNKLIAEAFYNTGIIEQWGSGTLRMANALKHYGQPTPQFKTTDKNIFELIMYRNVDALAGGLQFNDRQIKALEYLKGNTKLTNIEYQTLCGVSRATASRDLAELVDKGFVVKRGTTGKGTEYLLASN